MFARDAIGIQLGGIIAVQASEKVLGLQTIHQNGLGQS